MRSASTHRASSSLGAWTVLPLLLGSLLLASCHSAEAIPAASTVRLRLAQDPITLDPALATDQHSIAVVSQIFDGLVEFDPADLSVRPALAERWEISDNGLRYTFHLRPEARFHNGHPVTAEDVAFSFRRVLSPATKSNRQWVLSALAPDRIRVIDERILELTLLRPFAPLLTMLCLEAASIVPRDVYGAPGSSPERQPVGAGPFLLESWVPGERITLRRFASSSAADPRLVGRVVYRIIGSEATALEEYLSGGIDIDDEIPSGRRRELGSKLAGEYRRWAQPAIAYLGFNHRAAPFAGNRALRQAFNHAVDKAYICDVLNEGKDVPAGGVLPRGVPGYDPGLIGYPYDPERARALLAEAGYPAGRGLPEIVLYYNTSESQRRIMERVQINLAGIGVKIRLKSLDPAALMKSLEAGEPAFFRMAWLSETPDPDSFLTPVLHSASGPAEGNFARYSNPEFDRLIDRARGTGDARQRMEMYREAQRIAVEDACWVFLYFYGDEALVAPRVQGLVLPVLGDFLAPLSSVSIVRKEEQAAGRDESISNSGSSKR
ncbi:MAG TPA: ABC transporter substrate-binding protein [Candidatus Polarisedimenticolia bacterium]